MEKLQAAVERARRQRAAARDQAGSDTIPERDPLTGQPVSGQPVSGETWAAGEAAASGVDALWSALPEVVLDRPALFRSRILSQTASVESAPFDVLRTKILYQMRQNGWRRLAITSPLPSCGKSTTAVNLALGMGRQPELRTMLFDFDLRTPTVAQKMGLPRPPAITPLLAGARDFADHGCRVGENLALALSGVPDADPTRLLMSGSAQAVLDDIQSRYRPDVMIFDLPSILIGDDARAFLQHVDCALIVVRADQTRYADFDSCEREVAEYTNVLGVALNGYRHGEGLAEGGDSAA